jgi:hypothetical protein
MLTTTKLLLSLAVLCAGGILEATEPTQTAAASISAIEVADEPEARIDLVGEIRLQRPALRSPVELDMPPLPDQPQR